MTDVAEVLDRIVPTYDGTGDWDRVLRDAGLDRRSRRLPLRLAAAVALVAVAVVLVALWPSGAGPTVLDRALAATGDGPVLHLVYESELPRTLVDLETGERTEVRSQHEVWFDPQAGIRQIELFEGAVQSDGFMSDAEMPEHTSTVFTGLGADYREALESGRAEVVGEDVVDGVAVHWIRIESESKGAHDVAVSAETFEPVFVRITQDGTEAVNRILSYENIEAGTVPLGAAAPPEPEPVEGVHGGDVTLDEAASLLGREAVWAGPSLAGLPLAYVHELTLPMKDGDVAGITLLYGSAHDGPHVEIMEAATPADGLTMLVGLRGYAPPEGTVLLTGPVALLRSNGLVVTIHAPDEETAVAIARSLRPYGAPAAG